MIGAGERASTQGIGIDSVSGERGTEAVRALLEHAERLARERGADEVASHHVLWALAVERPGQARHVLDRFKVSADAVKARLPEESRYNGAGPDSGPLPPAPDIAAAVANAVHAAEAAGRRTFDTDDLLLALVGDRAAEATRLLERFGLDPAALAQDLARLRGQEDAIARAGGKDPCAPGGVPCPFHVGPGACAPHGSAGGPPPAVPGLHGEVRDLGARFDALVENHKALAERVQALIAYLRVLWAGSLVLLGVVAYLLWRTLGA